MPEVTVRDLRSFVAVVEEGTFTDAAIALRSTQATVSRHVAALEEALGARLLLRGARVARLTVTGRSVLRHARAVLKEVEAIDRLVHDDGQQIRLGYAWAALGAHTPVVQREWAQRHPGSELALINSPTRFAGLNEGLVDVAVVRKDPGIPQIATALLGHEDRIAALPAGHELTRRRRLTLADFTNRPLAIDSATGTTTTDLWTPQAAPSAVKPVSGTDEWLTVIAAGQAIGLTSRATSVQYSRVGVVYRPVADAPHLPVWLIWWRDDPPWYLDELCELIREQYRR